MSFLFPLGLVGLLSVPALVWLWRLQASRRQVRVPSLAPFEHLLQRLPSRRRRLHVNWLFWLQLAALILLAAALSEPSVLSRRASTTLVILDTSASMHASLGRTSPMRQAREELLRRLGRAGASERFFVMTTAPVLALGASPEADASELRAQVTRVERSDLGGTLASTLHVGRALLGFLPDWTVVLTDEPKPAQLAQDVEWDTFGAPVPNAAIVGVETSRSLCRTQEGQVVATVQNFAAAAQEFRIWLEREGDRLTEASRRLEPFERASLTLPVDSAFEGWVSVRIDAPENALPSDDRAWVRLHGQARIPVRLMSDDPAFAQAVGRWVEACPGLAQEQEPDGPSTRDTLVVTDRADLGRQAASRVLAFHRGRSAGRVVPAHWMPDASHPIGRYLEPLERMATAVTADAANGRWGDPVLWGLVNGERLPLVTVQDIDGRRRVHMFVDPVATPSSPPLVVTALNSLGWLAGSRGAGMTGEPLQAGGFGDGRVHVQRPDGRSDVIVVRQGRMRYNDTNQAGLYRLSQGGRVADEAVNFIDPIESDTMHRASTWTDDRAQLSLLPPVPARRTVWAWVLWVVLACAMLEWWLYGRKAPRTR